MSSGGTQSDTRRSRCDGGSDDKAEAADGGREAATVTINE